MLADLIGNPWFLSYFLADFACLILMVPILRKLTPDIGSEMQVTCFRVLILCVMIYALTDIVLSIQMAIPSCLPALTMHASTIINEIAIAGIAYFWFLYAEARLEYGHLEQRRSMLAISLPFLAAIVLSATSPATGLFYRLDAASNYSRGPLFLALAVEEYFYNIMVVFLAIRRLKQAETSTQREVARAVLMFLAAPVAAGIIQLANPMTPVMCIAFAVAIYFVFLEMVYVQVNSDAVTGLNNRRRAETWLMHARADASAENPLYVFVVDVDWFKQINDSCGHMEGDHALRMVADALRQTADQFHGFAARIGGDEFLYAIPGSRLRNPQEAIDAAGSYLDHQLQECGASYRLTLSIGYAACVNPQETIEALLARADQNQYETKRLHHRDHPGRER